MLISGQKSADTEEGILKQLNDIPSSFPDYYRIKQYLFNNFKNEGFFREAKLLYKKDIIGSIKLAEDWLERSEAKKDQVLIYNLYMNILGKGYAELGNITKAIEAYQDAMNIAINARDSIQLDAVSLKIAELYNKKNTLHEYELEQKENLLTSQKNKDQRLELCSRLALGSIYRLQEKHFEAVEQYANAYSLFQAKVNYEALRIEQHEFGISNKEKIGTDDIHDCVVLILQNPETKKSALAHIDVNIKADSISTIVNHFLDSTKLNAYLIGGKLEKNDYVDKNAALNIKNITSELKKHPNIDIISADILDKNQASGIVFDPITSKWNYEVPGKVDQSTALRQAKLIREVNYDLHLAFNLTKNKNTNLPDLSYNEKYNIINKYFSLPLIYDEFTLLNPSNVEYRPLSEATEIFWKNDPELVKNAYKDVLYKYLSKATLAINQKTEILGKVENFLKSPSITSSELYLKLKEIQADISPSLFSAIKNNNIEKLKQLIIKGADVNKARDDGITPLLMAAHNGHLDIVKELLDHKADVNKARDDGITPLLMAAYDGHLDIVKELLDHKADINKARDNGVTPLLIAAANGHLDIVEELLDHKADVNKARDDGITPLMSAIVNKYKKIAMRLLAHPDIKIDLKDNSGSTAVSFALQSGYKKLYNTMKDKQFKKACMMSQQEGRNPTPEIIKFLGTKNINLNVPSLIDGTTLLLRAIKSTKGDIVKVLLEAGADASQAGLTNTSPLQEALKTKNPEIVKLVMTHLNSFTKEEQAVTIKDLSQIIKAFNSSGQEEEKKDKKIQNYRAPLTPQVSVAKKLEEAQRRRGRL